MAWVRGVISGWPTAQCKESPVICSMQYLPSALPRTGWRFRSQGTFGVPRLRGSDRLKAELQALRTARPVLHSSTAKGGRAVPANFQFVKIRVIRFSFRYSPPPCSKRLKRKLPRPRRNSRICGGFFDVPAAQKRLGELDSLMAADNFWNNREKAQTLIDEANSLRSEI